MHRRPNGSCYTGFSTVRVSLSGEYDPSNHSLSLTNSQRSDTHIPRPKSDEVVGYEAEQRGEERLSSQEAPKGDHKDMSRIKLIMSAFVAVLAFSALASGSASAATAGWMLSGKLVSGSVALATTAKVDKKAKLVADGIEIECTSEVLNGVAPQITSPASGSATSLEFTGCVSRSGACTLGSTVIGTVPITAEATLDGALGVLATFSPKTKTTFTTIEYIGASCALVGVQPVTGKVVVLDPTGQDEAASQLIEVTAASSLKVGSSAATFTGSALLKLASGEPWSFL
jgi:hypothetical protein